MSDPESSLAYRIGMALVVGVILSITNQWSGHD